jgi:hypothetical protein
MIEQVKAAFQLIYPNPNPNPNPKTLASAFLQVYGWHHRL